VGSSARCLGSPTRGPLTAKDNTCSEPFDRCARGQPRRPKRPPIRCPCLHTRSTWSCTPRIASCPDLSLSAERLSDLLNGQETFELFDVLVEDLTGTDPMEAGEVDVARDEILLVHAGGPRGNPGRRQRTRQHPIVVKIGLYEVRGYVHALPGSDPLASLRRRKPMVALTDAVIEFVVASAPQVRRASVVIVNRDAVDWIVEGHDAEVVMPEMPVDSSGLLLKDFTGDVHDLSGAD
jgi:hypothetical protein